MSHANHDIGGTVVNFIAFDARGGSCLMVLVEGPWSGSTEEHLRALQGRIYGCLEAALDGRLAEQFPDAKGKCSVVRVDCYDVPREEVDGFLRRFAEGVGSLPDYATDDSPYFTEFRFEAIHDTLASES